ncbi:MAG: hypothetical protein HRT89_17545 [Lentisphaeria bacterium]|nr:hypothetical protein [Lentisphaeria bacterium]NQZ69863.1 hypothetical protein [Lentisphaeria bacterium]
MMKISLTLFLLLSLTVSYAQENKAKETTKKVTAADQKKMESLFALLGADKAADRRKARKDLIAMGEIVVEFLKKHQDHEDPEIANSVGIILATVGIYEIKDFIGEWYATKPRCNVIMKADGTWVFNPHTSIKGKWYLKDKSIVWTTIPVTPGPLDVNPILLLKKNMFKIKELDGEITIFTRIKK